MFYRFLALTVGALFFTALAGVAKGALALRGFLEALFRGNAP
jgi:hypothetical protein